MDKISLAILVVGVYMLIYGYIIFSKPLTYQEQGKVCEKTAMSVCERIRDDYKTFGTIFILIGLLISCFAIFELIRKKRK